MKKRLIYFSCFILILIILTLFIINKIESNNENQKNKVNTKIIFENNKEIFVEMAETSVEIKKGLMFRESLDKDKGMLFIFKDSAIRTFWMKNTYIPLDIIFIDENFTILNIDENVPSCIKEPCQTYSSLKPAKYVLEINRGVSKENGLKERQKVKDVFILQKF